MDPEMKRVIIALLETFGGNRSKVARVLHISRNTVVKVAEGEKKKNKMFDAGEEKSRQISNEYQSVVKTVRRLSLRVQGIEDR